MQAVARSGNLVFDNENQTTVCLSNSSAKKTFFPYWEYHPVAFSSFGKRKDTVPKGERPSNSVRPRSSNESLGRASLRGEGKMSDVLPRLLRTVWTVPENWILQEPKEQN
jgi:hypothetical protein